MPYKLVPETDSSLKKKVPVFSGNFIDLAPIANEMFSCMRENEGIGLSANQVGLNIRMFVMEFEGKQRVVINPNIVTRSSRMVIMKEGCLSFPNLLLDITRVSSIQVEYIDLSGRKIKEDLTDLEARCFLHETDHLNGVTFDTKVPASTLALANTMRLIK